MGFPSKTPKMPTHPGQQLGPQPSATAGGGPKGKAAPLHTPPPLHKKKGFTGAPK